MSFYNPLAKACGLSPRTGGQTKVSLLLEASYEPPHHICNFAIIFFGGAVNVRLSDCL